MTAILRLTNGTTRVDFMRPPWSLEEWVPAIASAKGGGDYSSSPLTDGQRLRSFRWGNVTERLTVSLHTANQNAAAREMQKLRRLLVEAQDYWVSAEQPNPVYLEARSPHETNTRYALIQQGNVNEDGQYYGQEFTPITGRRHASMVELPLVLERSHWLAHPPGAGECLRISGQMNWQTNAWAVQEAGPVGTVYDIIETSAGTLLAADTSQVWRSTTGLPGSWAARSFAGGHWDFNPDMIFAMCEDGSANVYAACANGVFRSVNDGLNWTRRTAARNAATPNSIAWNPAHAALWLADKGEDIYYSTDGGLNWTANGMSAVGEIYPNCIKVMSNHEMVVGLGYGVPVSIASGTPSP